MTAKIASLEERRRRAKLTAAPHNPALRGYHAVYRPDQPNFCPGCGRSHWYVGRAMAECGFCATALPIGREVWGG